MRAARTTMCGIAGIFNLEGEPVKPERIWRAAQAQRHRGPDDEGYLLVNTRSGSTVSCGGPETNARLELPLLGQFNGQPFDLAFGFRRLSIQDLSPAGHQPMSSADGRFWIVFNGEIYNYLELRAELKSEGFEFHTGTDTEVILAAYQRWGTACLKRFNGMWAFALWDSSTRSLFLARDRFGEKPLHYVYEPGKLFAFASEIKALWAAGIVGRDIDSETLKRYQYYGQVDVGEQTFYQNVFRLSQAHYMLLKSDGTLEKGRYWDIDPRIQDENQPEAWYSEQFRELLSESVRIRLRSDVPVGSSLSGGLDSSTLVLLMDKLLPPATSLRTFSSRFNDPAKDEGKWIEMVAAASRIDSYSVWPTGEQFFEHLSTVFWHQEEPFTSTSIYAQWCVMKLAKERGVTVLLDGQGADEMLAGYHSYFGTVSDDLLKTLKILDYLKWEEDCRNLHGLAPGSVARVLRQSMPLFARRLGKQLVRSVKESPDVEPFFPTYPDEFKKVSGLRKILWWETTRHGLVELLRYADRNSMAHSREVRLPFLDHRLVEFVFRLPLRFLIRQGWTKWILRDAFKGMLPSAISQRADKLGYMPPPYWLKGVVWEELMLKQVALGCFPAGSAKLAPAAALTITTAS